MEIRRSYDPLISTMGFPILIRLHLYIESGPRLLPLTDCMSSLQKHLFTQPTDIVIPTSIMAKYICHFNATFPYAIQETISYIHTWYEVIIHNITKIHGCMENKNEHAILTHS